MLGLPRVIAAKAQDQLDVVGGFWSISISSLFHTQTGLLLLSSNINVTWCSEKVIPFF